MNQILLTGNENNKKRNNKYKNSNNTNDMKKIIMFFGVIILVFGLAIVGVYGYKVYKNNRDDKVVVDIPQLSLEKTDKTVTIITESKIGINKIIYTWNEEEPEEIVLDGKSKRYEKMLNIPNGENTLNVKVIDQSGQENETNETFQRDGDIEKPVIETAIVENSKLKITAKDETAMKYITYKWNDEEEVKVESENEEDKEIEVTIDVKRGESTLTITAVDSSDNTETVDKPFKGVLEPEFEVRRNGDKLYMKISHDMGFEKIEFSVNGQVYTYDENFAGYDATQKEIEYQFDLKEGENTVVIVAISNEGTDATYMGKCDYTAEQ